MDRRPLRPVEQRRWVERSPTMCEVDSYYTRGHRKTHVTESGEVLYPWHPWFGRVVYFHQLIELGREHILRCDLGEKPTARCTNVPAWMFDRAACLRVRRADTPQVELAALICLKALLAEVANRTSLVAAVVGARHSFENRGDADAAAEPSITNDPTRSVPSLKSATAQLARLAGRSAGESDASHRADAEPARARQSSGTQGRRRRR